MLCLFLKKNGFPVTLLHLDKRRNTIRQKNGAGIKQVHCLSKEEIIQEASAYFGVKDHVLAYKDGSEVPDNFNLILHMKDNNIIYRSRVKACHRLYLINSCDKKGIEINAVYL